MPPITASEQLAAHHERITAVEMRQKEDGEAIIRLGNKFDAFQLWLMGTLAAAVLAALSAAGVLAVELLKGLKG